jgi:hypothetical protein
MKETAVSKMQQKCYKKNPDVKTSGDKPKPTAINKRV